MPPLNNATQTLLAAKKSLRPYLTFPAWAAMGLVLAAAVLLPAQTMTKIAPYPFLFSLVFLGLPHGAWDHLVVNAARGTRLSAKHLAAVCVSYSLLVALFGVFWFVAPSLAFAAFIVMSWLHWGQGDAAYLRLWQPERVGGPAAWLIWLVRGGAPILLPILRFPGAFGRVADGVVGLFSPQHAPLQIPLWGRAGGFVLLAALGLAYLFLLFRPARRDSHSARAACEDAAEVVLLYGVFMVADPLFAVGIYFCFWHGSRHIGRLLLLDKTSRALCAEGRVLSAGARFGGQCFPILLVSLGLLGAACRAAAAPSSAPHATLYVYLALIACLTFPHFLLVCWMDKGPN